MDLLHTTNRLGRSNGLTTYKKYFKKSWKQLEKASISKNSAYTTDITRWACNCGRQKYDAHHLCKHLVQAVNPPPPEFWGEVIRRRKSPIYHHQSLIPHGEAPSSQFEPIGTGSITDGDDAEWDGDVETLHGGGRWETMVNRTYHNVPCEEEQLRKWKRPIGDSEAEKENQPVAKTPKVVGQVAEMIDLTMIPDSDDESDIAQASTPYVIVRSSSPGALLSEDDDDQVRRHQLLSSCYVCSPNVPGSSTGQSVY